MMEVLIVTVIIGILAALGFGNLLGPKEQAMDKEAMANLKLIASAEKVYRMEYSTYQNYASTALINTNLRLMLASTNPNWEYEVRGAAANTFWAVARRVNAPVGFNGRMFCINEVLDSATNVGCVW